MFFMDVGKQVIETPQSQLCCDENTVQYAELKYVKLSFIPLFPFSTHYQTQCKVCKSTIEAPKNRISILSIFNKFIGTAIVLFIALYFWQGHQEDIAKELDVLNDPQKYDFYLIDNNRFKKVESLRPEFVIAKVISANKDVIEIVISNYIYSRKRDLIKAIRLDTLVFDDFFPTKTQFITPSELNELYKQEIVYRVLRPFNYTLFGGVAVRPTMPEKLYKGYNPTPLNQEGIRSYRNDDFVEALSLFKQAAELGDEWAQINLAQMYRDGEGSKVDNAQALYWFNEAMKLGNKTAEFEYQQLCKKETSCKI